MAAITLPIETSTSLDDIIAVSRPTLSSTPNEHAKNIVGRPQITRPQNIFQNEPRVRFHS